MSEQIYLVNKICFFLKINIKSLLRSVKAFSFLSIRYNLLKLNFLKIFVNSDPIEPEAPITKILD